MGKQHTCTITSIAVAGNAAVAMVMDGYHEHDLMDYFQFILGEKIMHARVVTSQLQAGKRDEWIGICRDSIVPALRQQPGFKGFVMLADTNSDQCIAYSMWETEAELKASETSGFYQEQVAKLSGVLAAPPVRAIYELTVLT